MTYPQSIFVKETTLKQKLIQKVTTMKKEINYRRILGNSLSALELFKDDIKAATLIHIPHSSTYIPSFESMDKEKVEAEIQLLTDWGTEKIFDIVDCTQLVVPFSRVFCDVERLPDDQEAMFKKGRGFYYTHTDFGERLRNDNAELKQHIFDEYYQPHHDKLLEICQTKINEHGFCFIIDAHSFSEKPLLSEENQQAERPDICIGTDAFHTPEFWTLQLTNHFEGYGLTVEINHPYSGTIVPLPMYKKEERLYSVMIEINKRCYMQNNKILPEKIEHLSKIMNAIYDL